MTKEELEKATGQELIEQRDYCGRDNYYYEYLENVNAEMLKRFNRLAELETRCNELFLQTCEQAEKIKELKSEIESEIDLPAIAYMQGAEKQKKKDEEELKKWKDEWQEQVQKATDEGYARTLQTIQLTKAKELLKQWLQTSKASGCDNINIVTDTEQFLNSEGK